MKNRLGIFCIYDQDGIADDYIFYLLDDLVKNLEHLVIVCNGVMQEDSNRKLKQYTEDVVIRENEGYDWGAYKYVLSEYLGWDKVRKYEELVLANDSCYGPFYPFREVFDEMDNRDPDFWGITDHMPVLHTNIPYHIQSYFLVIRNRLLNGGEFADFWVCQPSLDSGCDARHVLEFRFTEYFHSRRYESGIYVDNSPFRDTMEYNYSIWDAYRLISEKPCPLIRREVFASSLEEALRYNSGETARRSLDYIKCHSSYDVGLIWKNLIRTCDVTELYNSLHLNYIFPSEISYDQKILEGKKIAVIAHLYYSFQLEENLDYIDRIPECIDIIITTCSESNATAIRNHFTNRGRANYCIVPTENRGRDIAALLVGCKDYLMKYDYLCFVHDKNNSNNSNENMCLTLGRSYKDLLWENALKSSEYIENVIACFEDNPLLGFLSVPPLRGAHRAWEIEFDVWEAAIKRLGLKCKFSKKSYPISLGTAFWCRTAALGTVFNYGFAYEDFPSEPLPLNGTLGHAIERIFPFAAQHEGYHSGIMMTMEYSSIYSVLFQYSTRGLLNIFRSNVDIFDFAESLREPMHWIVEFISRFRKIYIYGAGKHSEKCIELFLGKIFNFMGIIVSDGHKQKNSEIQRRGFSLFELSEISPNDDEGIIIAIGGSAAKEVIHRLSENGFKNFICYLQC